MILNHVTKPVNISFILVGLAYSISVSCCYSEIEHSFRWSCQHGYRDCMTARKNTYHWGRDENLIVICD